MTQTPTGETAAATDRRSSGGHTARRLVRVGLERIAGDIRVPGWDLTAHLTAGKQSRSRLVLVAAELGAGGATGTAVRYARAVELLHSAGLCHDDIVDRSPVRRGRPTAWAAIGPKPALLIGAWLVARAAEEVANEPTSVRRAIARRIRDVVRGQTDELMDAFDDDVSPDAYLRRAYGKTGALYELAGWLGAVAGHCPRRDRDVVARFAARTGIAFQLADDLRDLVGEALLGRDPGTDLRMGIHTMPVLLTLGGRHRGATRLRSILRHGGSRDACGAVLALVRANGAWDASVRQLDALVAEAADALHELRPSPERSALAALAHEIVGPIACEARVGSPAAGSSERRIARWRRGLLGIDLARTEPAVRRMGARMRARLGRARGASGSLIDCAAASAALLAVADDLGRARAASVPRLVGLADLLVADVLASVATMPVGPRSPAPAIVSAFFRAAVERSVADPRARLADDATLDTFAESLAAIVPTTPARLTPTCDRDDTPNR